MAEESGVCRALKRRKLDSHSDLETESDVSQAQSTSLQVNQQSIAQAEDEILHPTSSASLQSLCRAISPPINGKSPTSLPWGDGSEEHSTFSAKDGGFQAPKTSASPFQLTHIRDLPSSSNVDAVSLSDLLGDPLIKECWQFNYLLDVDFIMKHLDEDVRSIVKVKIIHGSWKKEDGHRLALEEAAKRYQNVQLITAFMPEPFGTHHSKMMVFIRQDDSAQVVVHTANMISQDWSNMCQAVWRSPLLPLNCKDSKLDRTHPIGSGERFKADLLRYLRFYGRRLGDLPDQLDLYDFGSIRAAFIATVPERQKVEMSDSKTSWGWLRLGQVLRQISCRTGIDETPSIHMQVSSVATLGRNDDWLQNLFDTMSVSKARGDSKSTFPEVPPQKTSQKRKPKLRVIFPTADTIRRSLNGYASGGSIHWKIQSGAQRAQLDYFRPYLCHWAGDGMLNVMTFKGQSSSAKTSSAKVEIREAGRRRTAPHIKTYIRFSDESQSRIDWAMLTSANLSTQAWGSLPGKKDGEVRTSSFETGVVIWPSLFPENNCHSGDEEREAVIVPTFGSDSPSGGQIRAAEADGASTIVGFRMPYDLPLVPYADDDEPWCASAQYEEPDWKGIAWV